jgi:hypothetical protein
VCCAPQSAVKNFSSPHCSTTTPALWLPQNFSRFIQQEFAEPVRLAPIVLVAHGPHKFLTNICFFVAAPIGSAIYDCSNMSNPIYTSYTTADCSGTFTTNSAGGRGACSRRTGEFSTPTWGSDGCFEGDPKTQFVGKGFTTVSYNNSASCNSADGNVTMYGVRASEACVSLFDGSGFNSTYTNCGNNYKVTWRCRDFGCSVGCQIASSVPSTFLDQ